MQPNAADHRALDAGFNRLTEGLRVVEDTLRFSPSPRLAAEARRWAELRRAAGDTRRELEREIGAMATARDVAADPNAPVPPNETARADLDDLLAANVSRAREASRSVEERLRVVSPSYGARIEKVRYEIYAAEERLAGVRARAPRLDDVRLYVLVTTDLCAGPVLEVTEAALAGGAQMIQLREKTLAARPFLALAEKIRDLTARYDALFVVNDRVEIASLTGADGVHQGQEDLLPAQVRRFSANGRLLVGVSTHNPDQAARADADGADYIGVGPIYPTQTKEHRSAVGLEYIRASQETTPVPGYAIGSVNRKTLPAVLEAGATRVAVCTGIIGAENVQSTARWFRDQLDQVQVPTEA